MSKGKIHFRNKPFTAIVVGKGDQPIQCIPVVYEDMFNCGIGIFYENGTGQAWGMVSPRDLITAWRATEIIRHLDTIESGTLCAAFYAGARKPNKSEMESYVRPTIVKIGQEVYEKIMHMPVPESIIQAILTGNEDDSEATKEDDLILKPDLYPIIDEVRAGTIQWRQEFADAGIKHPDDIDAKKRSQDKMIAKFERLLVSYAESLKLSRRCLGMKYVESALLTLIDKSVGHGYSDRVLVALAGVVGELAISGFAMNILLLGFHDCEDCNMQIDKTKEKALDQSALWLSSTSGRLRIVFWKRQQDSLTFTSAKELLHRLLEEYFSSEAEAILA